MTMTYNVGQGSMEIVDRQIRSTLAQAALRTNTQARVDAAGFLGYPEGMIEDYRPKLNEAGVMLLRADNRAWQPDEAVTKRAAEIVEEYSSREDAAPVVGAPGFARDFELIHASMIEEARPPMSGLTLFPQDTSVPLGWPTHTWRRVTAAGRARWHNRGEQFPIAKAGYAEESFKTGFIVCATEQSYFTGLQLGVAGLRTYEFESRAALRAIDEFMNELVWYGDPSRQIYGVLTHPNVPTMVTTARFSSASTGEVLAAELIRIINIPITTSAGTFFPNRIGMAPELRQYVLGTPLNAAGGTVTIWEFVKAGVGGTTSGINDIEIIPELSDENLTAGGVEHPSGGYHGIFLWNDSIDSIAHVVPQRPTFLPVWNSSPIDQMHVAFGSSGGVVMNNVGSNMVIFARR